MTSLKYYTYAHYTKDTQELFYIGKGSGKRATISDNRNQWWRNKVNKHTGFTVEILAYWKTELEALEHEKFLIDCLEATGTILTNIHKALGRETGGRKLTAVTCERMSKAGKTRWANLTDEKKKEFGEKTSKILKGRPFTDLHRKHLSDSRKGLKVPSAWKQVFCKTTNTFFNSVREAASKTGCDPSHIVKCCKGKLIKTKNLEFTYV